MRAVSRYAGWIVNHPRFLWMLIVVFSMGIAVASWHSGKQRPHIPLQDLEVEDTSEEVDRFRLDRSEGFLVIRGDQLFTKSGVPTIRRIVAGLETLPQIQDVFGSRIFPPLIFSVSPQDGFPNPMRRRKNI